MNAAQLVAGAAALAALVYVVWPILAPRRPTGCPVCGPRPERDPVFCSNCGRRL